MPLIIHRYLTKTYTNPQPPGFADFLRGTIALYQLACKNNYTLKIDVNSHPIFKFLDIPKESSVTLDENVPTIEIIPPIAYDAMHGIIELGLRCNDLVILTNAFYNEQCMTDEYQFIRSILTPSRLLSEYIETIKTSIQLHAPYIVIHARIGDTFLVYKNDVQENIIDKIRNYIKMISTNAPAQSVLFIADSYQLKESVKDLCKITAIHPIHTGSLDTINTIDTDERLVATLAEFFIMSKASSIYCINFYDGSGYSKICSKIYSIDYHCLQL